MPGYEFDYVFDWTILKYQQAQSNRVQPRIFVSIFAFWACLCMGFQSSHASNDTNICHIAAGPWS